MPADTYTIYRETDSAEVLLYVTRDADHEAVSVDVARPKGSRRWMRPNEVLTDDEQGDLIADYLEAELTPAQLEREYVRALARMTAP